MKWRTTTLAALVLQGVLTTAVAQEATDDLPDSYRRLTEAVARTRSGEIQPQTTPQGITTPTDQPGAQESSALARALAAQQANDQTQRAQEQAVQPQVQANQPTPQQEELSIQDEAFLDTRSLSLPLSAQQIKVLREQFSQVQRAAATHPGVPPRPTSTSIAVDLSPGATPPIIRLRAGFVTSLVFVDASGAPWPIAAFDLGDPRSYNIQWDKKGNTLLVQAITEYKSGNLAVMLKDSSTPVMVTLLAGQRAVDYRVDLRLPGLGPNATVLGTEIPTTESPVLLNILNGVAPRGSKKLRLAGGEGEIWSVANRFYVRTRMTLLSPGWIATMSSVDGLHAYEMQKTPVILASYHGKLLKLTVEGL